MTIANSVGKKDTVHYYHTLYIYLVDDDVRFLSSFISNCVFCGAGPPLKHKESLDLKHSGLDLVFPGMVGISSSEYIVEYIGIDWRQK